jgi:uncharacterized protein (DUF433 family)
MAALGPVQRRVVGFAAQVYSCAMASVVNRDPEIMSGTPVFMGTRVPVQHLIDFLEEGDTIDEFLDSFPSVSREQVIAFLEEARDRVFEAV